MHLKLYLNKYLKADNIELYSLRYLIDLKQEYDNFLDLTGGYDPDFPNINIGDRQGGQKIKGTNKFQFEKEFENQGENDFPDSLGGIDYDISSNTQRMPAGENKSGTEEILNLHK
jgi:hypothetical protein